MPTPFDLPPPDFGVPPLQRPAAAMPVQARPQAPMPAMRPPQMPPPQQPQGIWQQILPLVLGGIAGRGDPTAMAAGASGWMQGQELRRKERMQAQEYDRTRAIEAAEFYRDLQQAAAKYDDETALRRDLEAMRPLADVYGINVDTIRVPDERVQARAQREAAEKFAQLEKVHGAQVHNPDWQQQHSVDNMPVSVLARIAGRAQAVNQQGQVVGPSPATPTEERLETRSLQVQAADALARGDTETYQRLLRVQREMGQADDRPPSPNVAPATVRRANQLADSFRNDPTVKRVNVQAEAVSFVNSLSEDSRNPADDQALIYAFAKAMDPDSVVREGEYAVVQKYAQSWTDNFGFNALRVIDNREFLTPEARRNMKATILARYAAGRRQYDNLRRQYADQINRATGQADGEDYLLDYAAAFPATTPGAVQPPNQTTGRAAPSVAPPAPSAGAGGGSVIKSITRVN